MGCSKANCCWRRRCDEGPVPSKNAQMTIHANREQVRVRQRPGRWLASHLILLATTAAAALLCCERAAAFTRSPDALRLPLRASYLQQLQQSSSRLEMAKGDGKKKRKKKSAAAAPKTPNVAAPAASAPAAIPMRVMSDSNISVKRQIKWARMKKEHSQVGQSFRQPKVVRTKYRRTWDEEEIEEKRIERSQRGKEPDWDVILNQTASSPLFIVDGYNVIHKWPRLKKWMTKGQLHRARDTLVYDLEELRRIKGWRIECVFDGAGKASDPGPLGSGPGGSEYNANKVRGSSTENTKAVTSHGVRVVFTGAGASADSYIEHRCFDAKKVTRGELTGSLIVASNDGMIRLAGTNAGALCMSSERLVDELKATRASILYRVEVAVAEANGHGVRPSVLQGTAAPGRFQNKMMIVDKRKKKRAEENRDEANES